MSQFRKKRTDSRSTEKASGSKAIDKAPQTRRSGFIIISVVIILILIIVGVFYYQEYVAPFQRTVLIVDDTTINMGFFLKRSKAVNINDPMTMLDALTKEQLIKVGAPRYVGEMTPEDIDQELRRIARGESETISEGEFKEWYRQQLNESGLSDSEFKEYVATGLLAARLHEYLAERVPTVAEQVHLHTIIVETYEEAQDIKERLEAGEDFATLAREVSMDEQLKEQEGDLGWFPRGVITRFDSVTFDLSIGEVSEPLGTEQGYYLLMVSEKADAREVDEDALSVLRGEALEDWLSEEMKFHKISYHGLNNGFDSETAAWINWQLSKK